jgi:hypothetical protein
VLLVVLQPLQLLQLLLLKDTAVPIAAWSADVSFNKACTATGSSMLQMLLAMMVEC